jgi:hypothetical protein
VGELNNDELVVLDVDARRGPIVASTPQLLNEVKAALGVG